MNNPIPNPSRSTYMVIGCYLFGVLTLPISLVPAQLGFYSSLVLGLWVLYREKNKTPFCSWQFKATLAYVIVAALTWFHGVHPEVILSKMHRLSLFFVMPVTFIALVGQDQKIGSSGLRFITTAFLIGVAAKGCYDLYRVPYELSKGAWLFGTGNMRDPQFYMVSTILLVSLLLGKNKNMLRPVLWFMLLITLYGLVIHFKRGVWLSCFTSLILLFVFRKKWHWIGGLALVGFGLCFLPPVQERLAALRMEFKPGLGGRMEIWQHIAPKMIAEHPFGFGYRGMTAADLKGYYTYVADGLSHLHNIYIQVLAETGWLGLFFWLCMMGTALVSWVRLANRKNIQERSLVLGWAVAFIGLLLNGVVENNFGDLEIFLLFMVVMGMAMHLGHKESGLPDVPPQTP